MRLASIQRILGFLIALSSLMMLPPALVSFWFEDGTALLFLTSAGILAFLGLCVLSPLACGDGSTGPEEPNPIPYQMRVVGSWEGITRSEVLTLIVQ